MLSALLMLTLSPAQAGEHDALFTRAAEDWQVPAPLLRAMAWEASRADPGAASAWGGYGMFDFREPGEEGLDIELVASLIDADPDDLMTDPGLQIQGAAAALAHYGASWSEDGAPEIDALEDWANAVAVMWGRQEPALQNLYVSYIYDLVDQGFANARVAQPPVRIDPGLFPPPPPSGSGDYAGIYQFVAAHSSNYTPDSRSGSDINYVIIHTTQGSYSGAISWFQNSSADVSAHYVIRSSDGQITQMLCEEDIGWHAGNWDYNAESIGIEHEGYVDDPGTWYTTAMYTASAALTADIISRTDVSADRSHVIAHSEVPGATHTDPGSGWDWDYYMGLVGGDAGGGGSRLVGYVADGDYYNEDLRLSGAAVTLDGSDSTSSDADGLWSFSGLGTGTYTVTASYPGFADGSCTKTVDSTSGDFWCSINLEPAPDDTTGGDDGGTSTDDGGTVDTGEPDGDDTGTDGAGDPGGPGGPQPPQAEGAQLGERVLTSQLDPGGCSTSPARRGGAAALLMAGLLAVRRRRG